MQKQNMSVWVDADSCPVQEEIRSVCAGFQIEPKFVATVNHFKHETNGENWTFLDHGSQSVDLFILNHVKPEDVVITQDYSLAVLLTPRGVYVITPRGKLIKEGEAFDIMNQKHLRQQTFRRKKKWKGPRAFTDEDRRNFSEALYVLIADREF
ncbi:YaiI/YqxD family protein [Halobacillus sp. B23F22_1]|uniref:YaiI/YqxD family protein n=1 Tax=Halobacillus sp. B23F22_1 TaxID=3459514 RepID=UPI00373E7877